MIPNWTDMQFYHYLIAAGAAVVVVALVLYFTPISRLKIPAILMGIAGGFGVGAALGVITMGYLGYHWEQRTASASEQSADAPGGPGGPGRMMMGGGGPGAPGRGGAGGRGGRGGAGPSSKNQLTSVITTLDRVTSGNGLKVTMDAEQKRKVREQIQKLDATDDLSEEDAKGKLDAVLGILTQEQRDTLDEAGANWGQRAGNRGGMRGGSGDAPSNPFKGGEANKHLKSLRDHMEEKSTK
jgi:hypothetical protein